MKKYLENRLKIKEENLKYDFLPSMLEIIEKPENKLSDFIIILVLGLLISAVAWSVLAQTDIIITSTGNVIPEGNVVSIVNAYGGEIERINVQDGDSVSKGQIIVSINSESEEASLAELEYQQGLHNAQKDAYVKIQDYENSETKQGEAENSELIETFGIDINQYGEYKDVVDAIISEQKLYNIQTNEYKLSKNSSDNKELIDNQLESFMAQRELTIKQNIASLENTIREDAIKISETKRTIENKNIVATEDGIITNISINSEGQIIPAGETVAYIIPDDSEIRFTAYVKSSDIQSISKGDKTNIRISALNDTEYETIAGTVEKIGELSFNMEGNGLVYKVEISMNDVPNEVLRIGTEGSCDIVTGKRRVIEYFIEPFIKGIRGSLHE